MKYHSIYIDTFYFSRTRLKQNSKRVPSFEKKKENKFSRKRNNNLVYLDFV